MADDHFTNAMEWISGFSTPGEKARAGAVVAWQCVANTLNDLVRQYHAIPTTGELRYAHYRQVQVKKLIIGLLYEAVDCIEKWAGQLFQAGLLTQDLLQLKDEFEQRYKVIGLGTLKKIRNAAAFHFTDLLKDGDAVVEVFTKIDEMPIDALDKLILAAQLCGDGMVQKVMQSIS